MIFDTAFGPIKEGTVANIIGTGRDYAIVQNNGKRYYVPFCFLVHSKYRPCDVVEEFDEYDSFV